MEEKVRGKNSPETPSFFCSVFWFRPWQRHAVTVGWGSCFQQAAQRRQKHLRKQARKKEGARDILSPT
jgi:hypothetical protein